MQEKVNLVPEDINQRLKRDFENELEYNQACVIVNQIKNDEINVGWVQLSRAVILIANGDLEKMNDIVQKGYYGDPRDVIMEMMGIPGNTNNYGMTPFEAEQ